MDMVVDVADDAVTEVGTVASVNVLTDVLAVEVPLFKPVSPHTSSTVN